MGFLSRITSWGKGKSNVDQEYRRDMAHSIIAGDASRLPQSDMEAAWDHSTNKNMIEDERLFDLLRRMSVSERQKLGKDGKPMTNGDGEVEMEDADFDLNMLATYIMTSKLIRTGYLDPIDADIMQAEARVFMDRIELELDEDSYELGATNLLDALRQIINSNIGCARNGRMAKLLKVTGKSYEVRTPTEGKNKKGQGEGSNLL